MSNAAADDDSTDTIDNNNNSINNKNCEIFRTSRRRADRQASALIRTIMTINAAHDHAATKQFELAAVQRNAARTVLNSHSCRGACHACATVPAKRKSALKRTMTGNITERAATAVPCGVA